MVEVILSLGSNLDDRALYMQKMEREVGMLLETPMVASCLMETEPVGVHDAQAWYYNRLVRGCWSKSPRELLAGCLAIETKLGRTRHYRYAARTADIDILLFGEELINEPGLIVPHQGLLQRKFCVIGLREIAPEWVFPGSNKTIAEITWEREKLLERQEVRIVVENFIG